MSSTGYQYEDLDGIAEAVLLLQSIGVQQICHPKSSAYEPVLPYCGNLLPIGVLSSADSGSGTHDHHFDSMEAEEAFYITNVVGVVVSVALVALMAGLFLGLLTLDPLDLQIIQRASMDEDEQLYASIVFPIVKERHRLLVTLLILNALAYETLPIFLDALVPGWAAVILSTTLILLFGEIVPSAVFTGPNQLYLAYHMTPLVEFLLFILYPLAMPLAMLLDYLVQDKEGNHPVEAYNRGELSALVRIQYEERMARRTSAIKKDRRTTREKTWGAIKKEIMEVAVPRDDQKPATPTHQDPSSSHQPTSQQPTDDHTHQEDDNLTLLDNNSATYTHDEEGGARTTMDQATPPLHRTEVELVEGALQMRTQVAMDVFTPLRQVYAVPSDLVLDKEQISRIYSEGFSRVPVYVRNPEDPSDRSSVLGFMMTRHLIMIDWNHKREVDTLPLYRPDCVNPRKNLVDLLQLLRMGGFLMAFVCARPELATKALEKELPIPPEAGFMGIITLDDVLESILQERIYDEYDSRERDKALATLNRWAASTLQSFLKRKIKLRKARERAAQQQQEEGGPSPRAQEEPKSSDYVFNLGSIQDAENGLTSDNYHSDDRTPLLMDDVISYDSTSVQYP